MRGLFMVRCSEKCGRRAGRFITRNPAEHTHMCYSVGTTQEAHLPQQRNGTTAQPELRRTGRNSADPEDDISTRINPLICSGPIKAPHQTRFSGVIVNGLLPFQSLLSDWTETGTNPDNASVRANRPSSPHFVFAQ